MPRRAATLAPARPPAWTARGTGRAGGAHAAHTLAAADIGGAVQPRVSPQCLMEATATPDVYTVTARGFSADFKADPGTGATRNGSAVWLQATVYAEATARPDRRHAAGAVAATGPLAPPAGVAATADAAVLIHLAASDRSPRCRRLASRRSRRGFTLIELLVAMAALAILAAVALPAFLEQLARARRVDVQAALLEDAGYMQHYYASHDAFTGTPPPRCRGAHAAPGAANYAIARGRAGRRSDVVRADGAARRRDGGDACGDFTYDTWAGATWRRHLAAARLQRAAGVDGAEHEKVGRRPGPVRCP